MKKRIPKMQSRMLGGPIIFTSSVQFSLDRRMLGTPPIARHRVEVRKMFSADARPLKYHIKVRDNERKEKNERKREIEENGRVIRGKRLVSWTRYDLLRGFFFYIYI